MLTNDESVKIASQTWLRNADCIYKIGYMDGAFDGQTVSYQTSFDKGFQQGIQFGLTIGFNEALQSFNEKHINNALADPRKINCQICIEKNTHEKIDNLVSIQEERNTEYIKSLP